MNRTFKAAAALILAVGFAGSVVAGPFDEADAAYKKGDYETALRLIKAAERGDARRPLELVVSFCLPVDADTGRSSGGWSKPISEGRHHHEIHR